MGGRNLPIPIDLAIGLYNSLYYRTSHDTCDDDDDDDDDDETAQFQDL